jgi:high affinity Mn2+ porin
MRYVSVVLIGVLAASLAPGEEWYSLHAQATLLPQGHPAFAAKYSGTNSLSPNADLRVSITSTLFAGLRVWKGGELYFNPEATAGSGISDTHGIAGYTNAEIYRVDSPSPKFYPSRFFLRQTFGLGGPQEDVPGGPNVIAGKRDISRLTITAGRFSLNDVFDSNAYAHDPRSQFMNWTLMDMATWDYAADTRGYTYGIAVEWNEPRFAIRFGTGLVATQANGMVLEIDFLKARADNLELEYRYSLFDRPGAIRLLGYLNRANMGNYRAAILSGPNPDITKFRSYSYKYGLGLNAEQEVASDVGVFLRAGWCDGATETWMFTEVEMTFSAGASVKGSHWGRPTDTAGIAVILNALGDDHRRYLAAGGIGFLIGDGALNYGLEAIGETYYSYQPFRWLALTGDYALVVNPAYNQDRGPVHVFSLRVHGEI